MSHPATKTSLQEMQTRPFGLRDKVGYALGDFGCNLSFALITAYLADFYTQYIGLTEATWAIIIIVLKIWDAINDPIMGGVMDSRKIGSKGKYKPWIRIGSFGLIVSGALAFMPIPAASYPIKVIVCVVTYLAWDVFYTLVNVPYGTLNSAITADANERTQLSTWRSIGAGAGGIITLFLPLLVYDDNNQLMGERFIWIGLVLGAIAFVTYQFCMRMTTERVFVEQAPIRYNYMKTLKRVLGNRPLIALGLASFALIVFLNSSTQTTKWVYQIYFQNTDMLTVANLLGSVSYALMIPFASMISRKIGKKMAVTVPLLISIVLGSVFFFVPMDPDGAGPILYIVCLFVIQAGGALFQLVCWAMVADCTDYQQLKTGVREEGSVYAIYSLFRKLAQGVGASLIILSMTWVGYEAKLGANQLPGVGEKMKNTSILLMLLGAVIMAAAMLLLYNIDKNKERSLKTELGLDEDAVEVTVDITGQE